MAGTEIDLALGAQHAVAVAQDGKPRPKPPKPRYTPKVLTVYELLNISATTALSQTPKVFCTTGHWQLDKITGGIEPKDVWLFGADTSWGKSSWGIAVADENMNKGKRVLIVTAEDSERLYGNRLMCRRSGCNAERLRDHCLSPAEVLKVQAIAKAALPVPVYMDAIGVEVEEIVAQLHQIIPQERIDLVLVDYIQSIHCRSLKQDRRTEVAFVAKELTDAIKACGAAGILFTQLTIESRIAIPSLHNVRDSKDVSHGAETIILGYEASSSVNGPDGVQMAVEGDKLTLCDKVKNGTRGGIIRHDWDTETASFKRVLRPVPGNYPPQYEPEERPAARAQRELRQAELWTGFDNDGARYGETQDRE